LSCDFSPFGFLRTGLGHGKRTRLLPMAGAGPCNGSGIIIQGVSPLVRYFCFCLRNGVLGELIRTRSLGLVSEDMFATGVGGVGRFGRVCVLVTSGVSSRPSLCFFWVSKRSDFSDRGEFGFTTDLLEKDPVGLGLFHALSFTRRRRLFFPRSSCSNLV